MQSTDTTDILVEALKAQRLDLLVLGMLPISDRNCWRLTSSKPQPVRPEGLFWESASGLKTD